MQNNSKASRKDFSTRKFVHLSQWAKSPKKQSVGVLAISPTGNGQILAWSFKLFLLTTRQGLYLLNQCMQYRKVLSWKDEL